MELPVNPISQYIGYWRYDSHQRHYDMDSSCFAINRSTSMYDQEIPMEREYTGTNMVADS